VTAAPDMQEGHIRILREALCAHLPRDVRVWMLGSRAHGGAQHYSDLDLALEWGRPLDLDVMGSIAEALSESDLPCKVDLVDLTLVDPGFKARVLRDCIPFDLGLREAGDAATLGEEAEPGG
jgi:predicted nucleotidyltransferase